MPGLDDLMSSLPLGDIAGKLGVDDAQAAAAAKVATPALLGGMQEQAKDPTEASNLASSLGQGKPDGGNFVSNMFGGQSDQLAGTLAKQANVPGVNAGMISKILPMLAPIVMGFVAKKAMGGGGGAGGGGVGNLGSALGGNPGGGLGNVLGGLLGGK